MTREEATNVLNKLQGMYRVNTYVVESINMAIETLSAEAVQGWIPCSERLPDWKDMVEGVIITTENGRVTFADYCTGNGMFHDVGQDVWASDILAWMPLPTPYRGGDTE